MAATKTVIRRSKEQAVEVWQELYSIFPNLHCLLSFRHVLNVSVMECLELFYPSQLRHPVAPTTHLAPFSRSSLLVCLFTQVDRSVCEWDEKRTRVARVCEEDGSCGSFLHNLPQRDFSRERLQVQISERYKRSRLSPVTHTMPPIHDFYPHYTTIINYGRTTASLDILCSYFHQTCASKFCEKTATPLVPVK